MTLQEVKDARLVYPVGTRFTHNCFSKDEYLELRSDGCLYTEDGYLFDNECFAIREETMGEGWSVITHDHSAVDKVFNDAYGDRLDAQGRMIYTLHNPYPISKPRKTDTCNRCSLFNPNTQTCRYCRKPIKVPENSSCKYGVW